MQAHYFDMSVQPVRNGQVLPLAHSALAGVASHAVPRGMVPAVGTVLRSSEGVDLFRIVGHAMLPACDAPHAVPCALASALTDLAAGPVRCRVTSEGYALAWVTLSDKGAQGQREDASGPCIAAMVRESMPLRYEQGFMLPDDGAQLRALLTELALVQRYDIVITTGGTGLGPRDVTPEATSAVIEKRLQGFEQAMLAASLAKTPHAVISRALAGTLGGAIIINLPGSRKAVAENLEAVLPALPHALAKLQGDPSDCAQA
jgi:molybdenum cofactor synthesis domain-containing protein